MMSSYALVVPAKAGPSALPHDPKQPCVYILSSRRNGALYIGVTSNLIQRVWRHKSLLIPGFTRDNAVHRLVWFEQHATMDTAIEREKVLKRWNRAWKIQLIEKCNPYWRDLYDGLS